MPAVLSPSIISRVFFFYGLAFFSLGTAVALELGRASEQRLRRAFGLLAFFGLTHGAHEWIEMFQTLENLPAVGHSWQLARLVVLAVSFLALAGFGLTTWQHARPPHRRWGLILLGPAAVWAGGIAALYRSYGVGAELWAAADVWTRYTLAIPAALLAAAGLLALRGTFRQGGLERFGRDSVAAALAFVFYAVPGQLFALKSLLPPSTILNADLFMQLFGFPVQLLRTAAAVVIAVFVVRVMRSFEVERRVELAELQEDRLREAERRQQLRGELLNRVVQAQEAERERIARELHDETGQALTAIGLGLRGVGTKLGGQSGEISEQLTHLEELTSLALNELQRLIAGLRPSHLDDLGLAAALRWFAGEVESRSPLSVHVEIEGTERTLPAVISVGLFRVAQEALTNVVKHASAELATVRLSYRPDDVALEVVDDGVGFDTPGADRPSWGLMGIQERIALMGGEFELNSERGRGTRVSVRVPAGLEAKQYHVGSTVAGR